ncbi:PQQ-binding-like beta-propeller repeat protein [Phytohabitans sp. ZYX-F-186]|uniref:PQQ-binding-like beta-propeller repeat protein n=1 Tax=Phytohabitans maris TaxID=3071409 RepID=A0ABU0ZUK0_9ACTN|nr:PQQ-binding-like beta-propeller repeat protein [Phytohabitans sp. ZYX-F-186]MDQ7910662.1 PQQ-binding-like beta-propeller repeat protein [Phytohabitans sp. ZYX-F-186]
MANGTASGRTGWVVAALIVLVILVSTNTWNPFPGIWEWVSASQPLSSPNVSWQQRLGSGPQSVTFAGNAVVVEHRTSVEARGVSTGAQLWEKDKDWAAVAGEGLDSVVVVGELLTKGYEVLDPISGSVRRTDKRAVAVWTYRNALLDVHCDDAKDCQLSAWEPRGDAPMWTVDLPGVGFVLFADNPDLLDAKALSTRRVEGGAGGPVLMPSLLGFPVDGKVRVVDTAAGRVVQDFEPDRHDRHVVVGGRVIRVQARSGDGTCYFTVIATDPALQREVWRHEAVNLRTAEGAGCAQREDPAGGQNVIVGVTADGREAVLDAYDGRVLWLGGHGEKLLAVDDQYALVRPSGGKAVTSYELGAKRARWSYPTQDPKAGVAIARFAVIVAPEDPDRIVALSPATGRTLADLRSSAKVLAVGPTGMIIGEQREIGFVPFTGTAPPASPGATPAPADTSLCDGPKEPNCGQVK